MRKEKMKKALKKLQTIAMLLMMGLMLTTVSPALQVKADDDLGVGQIDVKDIINSGKSLEESSLKEFGDKVNDIGGGAYDLTFKIGVWCTIIGLMIGGLFLIFSNSGNRNEAKSGIGSKVIGALLIFSAAGLVAYLQVIGAGLFS